MKRILVGLDGSARSPAVLSTAANVARTQSAKLTLFRAVGLPPDVPQDFWKSADEPMFDAFLRRRAMSYLEECAANVPSELLSGCEVSVGSPWQAICDAARNYQADLIVIGSHGYGGVDRLLGTTAAKVVNHAPCSVLVVRERPLSGPTGPNHGA